MHCPLCRPAPVHGIADECRAPHRRCPEPWNSQTPPLRGTLISWATYESENPNIQTPARAASPVQERSACISIIFDGQLWLAPRSRFHRRTSSPISNGSDVHISSIIETRGAFIIKATRHARRNGPDNLIRLSWWRPITQPAGPSQLGWLLCPARIRAAPRGVYVPRAAAHHPRGKFASPARSRAIFSRHLPRPSAVFTCRAPFPRRLYVLRAVSGRPRAAPGSPPLAIRRCPPLSPCRPRHPRAASPGFARPAPSLRGIANRVAFLPRANPRGTAPNSRAPRSPARTRAISRYPAWSLCTPRPPRPEFTCPAPSPRGSARGNMISENRAIFPRQIARLGAPFTYPVPSSRVPARTHAVLLAPSRAIPSRIRVAGAVLGTILRRQSTSRWRNAPLLGDWEFSTSGTSEREAPIAW
jgi:hypothetical protein